jgi:CHRD domain-containing protein
MRHRFKYFVVPAAVVAGLGAGFITAAIAADNGARTSPSGNPAIALAAHLRGGVEEVAPTLGDPDGRGTALVNVNPVGGEVCVELTTSGIGNWTMAHIHEGEVGTEGPIVVNFNLTAADVGPRLSRCVTGVDPALAEAIVDFPNDYYVNVHTADFPAGAVRGQLVARSSETQFTDPVRVYDSRASDGKLAVGTTRTIDLKVPLGVRAALITLTVDGTEEGGYVTAYANDVPLPETSTINWTQSNQAVGTTTMVAVDRDGKIKLTAGQNGTHVIVDVLGFVM